MLHSTPDGTRNLDMSASCLLWVIASATQACSRHWLPLPEQEKPKEALEDPWELSHIADAVAEAAAEKDGIDRFTDVICAFIQDYFVSHIYRLFS